MTWWSALAAKLRLIGVPKPALPPAPPPTFFYFRAFVALLLAQHVFETYVRLRRKKRLLRRGVPDSVRAALPNVDEREYERAQRYATAKNSFGFLADTFLLGAEATLLFAAPAIWNGLARRLVVEVLGLTPSHELARMGCSMLLVCPVELLIKVRAPPARRTNLHLAQPSDA